MKELSDGDLLYMIYFNRTNFTPKWIQEAEREAQRRRLKLHVINDDYRSTSIAKTIESEIDLEYSEPRTWQKKLYPWIAPAIVQWIYEIIFEREFAPSSIVLIFGLIGFAFYLWRNSKGKYKQVNTDTSTNKIAQ
jgi:hypothetical protein